MFNSFGQIFRFTSFGESHGMAVGCVVDGVPAGIEIDVENHIQKFLDLRRPNSSEFVTPRNEEDKVEILSGLYQGKTLGSPIMMLVKNKDQRSADYSNITDKFRPNHGDYVYTKKYGIRDPRGGGRSSARETIARVMAGSIARRILPQDIQIKGMITQIGEVSITPNWQEDNELFLGNKNSVQQVKEYLTKIREDGDSVGAMIEIRVTNMPIGLGEPIYQKLESNLASAIMGINAVKSFEIGSGQELSRMKGSDSADELSSEDGKVKFSNNNMGGIVAGISTGQDLIIRYSIKPTSSIKKEQNTINSSGENVSISVEGRHDPCVGIRSVPIAESMVACVLADLYLINKIRVI